MWFCYEEAIKRKLIFLESIDDLDCPDDIKKLQRNKPEKLHEWIQLLREQKLPVENDRENDEFRVMVGVEIQLVIEKTQIFVKHLLKHPSQLKHGIWLVRDLLGHNPLLFNTIQLSYNELESILFAIKSNKYENYPFVVLARYVESSEKIKFVNSIIEYANQLEDDMSWAMTGEACESLAFLNSKPEESMKCLARHLNKGGCDGMPQNNIIKHMHVFKEYGNVIIDELLEYLEEFGQDGSASFEVKYLSYFVCSKEIAIKLLEPVIKVLKIPEAPYIINSCEDFWEDNNYSESKRSILLFYGQLQAIIHNDI